MRIARILMTTALAGVAACSGSDSSTGPTNQNPVGTYPLAQIDEQPIPFEIYRGTYYDPEIDYTYNPFTVTVTGGELVLQNDGTYHISIDVTENAEGEKYQTTKTADGTYTIQGTTITIDGTGTGTLRAGNIITLGLEVDDTQKYRKYAFRLAK
jgi:hypothetical protein